MAGCAYLAEGAGAQSFLLGIWFRRGYCYAGVMEVNHDQYTEWEEARVNPECPLGDRSVANGFTNSMIFDFYAIEPVSED